MAGKLKEPRVITDHQREPVCILPTGFYFDDERWEKIWQRYAEKGEALTGDKFCELYLDILKKYYGHDQGITVIDDLYSIEWAYIPHFYYNFYVFQYSTSYLASQVLAEKMLSGEKGMVKKYLAFLSSGNSEYAIPTLKKVGIDMTTDEPFNLAMKKMNKIMDEMEAILSEMDK